MMQKHMKMKFEKLSDSGECVFCSVLMEDPYMDILPCVKREYAANPQVDRHGPLQLPWRGPCF